MSVRQLFTQYIDLGCAPTRSLLAAFAAVADGPGRARLAALLDEDDPNTWAQFLDDTCVAAAIREFAKCGVPDLSAVFGALPRMHFGR
jgi:sulfite reductase alpha subunit-like flavoprotein